MKNDQRRQKVADEIRKLSEAAGILAGRIKWACRDVISDEAKSSDVPAEMLATTLFLLAQDVASGRVELDGPDGPRPLFDRPSPVRASFEPGDPPSGSGENGRHDRGKQTEQKAPDCQVMPPAPSPPALMAIADLLGSPTSPDYLVKCNACGFTQPRSAPGGCPKGHVGGWSYAGPAGDFPETEAAAEPAIRKYTISTHDGTRYAVIEARDIFAALPEAKSFHKHQSQQCYLVSGDLDEQPFALKLAIGDPVIHSREIPPILPGKPWKAPRPRKRKESVA